MPALEAITVGFDVLAGVAVFLLGLRFFGRRAGLIAALVYHASPVNPLALSAGNFTNVFALGSRDRWAFRCWSRRTPAAGP